MAGESNDARRAKAARRALSLVTEAMDLLDAHNVAPDAAAHLALAQQRLRQVLER
jgi:hypothetical protein